MPIRLHKELEKIKKQILALGAMVEERVRMAIKATETKDDELCKEIRIRDLEIDEKEVEVEEECLKILALHQPVAVDLRFLVAVIKINNDLERIGDEAVNVAKRVHRIVQGEKLSLTMDYSVMGEKAASMLKWSLDALVNLDVELALTVLKVDDEVDKIHMQNYEYFKQILQKQPDHVDSLINYLNISRHLERIADHATNIAQEVVFLIEGEIVRHGKWREKPGVPVGRSR
ncbi:MAG: phosphate signaling complex protein PhoU [Desulfatiglandales bacterium]